MVHFIRNTSRLFNDELRESVEAHARERAQNQRSINSSADPLMDALLRADSKLNSCSATAVSVADCSVQYRAEINACLAFFRNLNQEKVPDFLKSAGVQPPCLRGFPRFADPVIAMGNAMALKRRLAAFTLPGHVYAVDDS